MVKEERRDRARERKEGPGPGHRSFPDLEESDPGPPDSGSLRHGNGGGSSKNWREANDSFRRRGRQWKMAVCCCRGGYAVEARWA
ncbi:hypothetical protein Ddc_00914 [Ditylenchus destructor]|nr:hypothetical protein Ddc_00914 [Ditylenchus destructor]